MRSKEDDEIAEGSKKPIWKIKPESPLDNFLKERGNDIDIREDIEDMFYKRDKLTISVSYTKCIKLDEIEIPKTWSQRKRKAIKKWATPDELCSSEYNPPEIEIEYDLSQNNYLQEKFKIVDGIHRLNRAKKLGKECIRVLAIEQLKVDKTDTNNIERIT